MSTTTLEQMTVKQLRAYAKEQGLPVTHRMRKEEILAAVMAQGASQENVEPRAFEVTPGDTPEPVAVEDTAEDEGTVPFRESAAWKAVDFPVALEPLFTEKNEEVPNRLAVIRQDTRQVLNVVSNRYKLIPHAKVFTPIAEAIQTLGLTVAKTQARVGMDGSFARFHWILDTNIAIRPQDDLAIAITMVNSYNYEARFVLSVGAHRWICRNGLLTPPIGGTAFDGKHMHGLDVNRAISEVSRFLKAVPEMVETYKQWAEIQMPVDQFEDHLRVLTLSEKARKEVVGYYITQEKTLWDAYNALTWYATHRTPGSRGVVNEMKIQKMATEFALNAFKAASRN